MRSSFGIAITVAVAATMGTMYFGPAKSVGGQNTDSVEFREGGVFPTIALPYLDRNRPGSITDFRKRKLILHIFASW